MFDLCHCQQSVYNKVLRLNFVIDQILIFHHNLQINSLKILQCDFLDFFFLILSLIVEVYLLLHALRIGVCVFFLVPPSFVIALLLALRFLIGCVAC